ncbi:cell wall metabolism sensor histidine kinase WalK [uncultured Modestobacter sp.]|uniref:sensor histidine kinase n=1 Tax=uncultured Modestobacter sp. TaxID=380048 RepID=UPI002631E7DC|nr:HAMP domain-containing sensor histidine kinase [uncultured Modestobacter sp.]
MPLRVTLVALLVALVTLALAATGLTATSLLRGYLIDQQDRQLVEAVREVADRDPTYLANACSQPTIAIPGGYLACLGTNGSIREFAIRPSLSSLPYVDDITAANVDEYGSDPFTVRSRDGSTSWRVIVVPVTDDLAVLIGTDLGEDRDVVARLVRIELFVGLLVLVVLGVAGYLLVRSSLRPLQEVEHTAQAIAAGDLSRRVPVGDERTEVGRLSTALNGMLGRIESSFRAQQASEEQAVASEARMRRFVADASHELRTPLTSIRGFAELHRQGAVRGPEDTGRIMQRIEAEATRMGLLVEDLLQLARLDQQRPLTLVPVDLAELAGDAVHDARAVQPDRPLGLQLDPSLTDVPVVRGDEARLRQVIGNLVTNALTHTPADARVTVRLSEDPAEPGTVVLAVSDEGPGLAPADAERVFERFYRVDASRTRAAGGTGLGLSIVSSLVAAHGGRVELLTAPGEGATFAVHLPRSGPATAEPGPG